MTISSSNLFLSLSKIDHAVDGFQNVIRSASLRHCHIKKGGLILSFGLHGSLILKTFIRSKTFAEISERVASGSIRGKSALKTLSG